MPLSSLTAADLQVGGWVPFCVFGGCLVRSLLFAHGVGSHGLVAAFCLFIALLGNPPPIHTRLHHQLILSSYPNTQRTNQTIHPLFTEDVTAVWSYEASVERKNSAGGTAKASVLAQVATVRAYLQGL